ncbi:MAG: histidine phosphatase family protein [Phycisphaerae bacterium]|nr:histidine phosphatase family protein [Phycisphaerae bacterium]
MARLILIPTAQTDWRAQGRLAGDTDLPLNEYGHRQAVAYAQAIADLHPAAVHCGPETATRQTGAVVAGEFGIKARSTGDLREMDLGHWEGLTQEEFRERFAKVYRQWRSAPMSIEPPEGEAVAKAAERLHKAVQKIVKRHQDQTVVLTLGQFAYAIVRCQLDDGDYERFWEYVDGDAGWHAVKTSPAHLAGPPASDASQPEDR